MEKFLTIQEHYQAEIVEKKSKFIAELYPVQNREEIEQILKQIRKTYYDAKHHCFAYRFIEKEAIIERVSDDKEPSGTAGVPILNLIKGRQLCNILIVVTRYFGGILLGTGGLVRAYSEASIQALEQANYIPKELGEEVEVLVPYGEVEKFKYYCKKNGITICKEKYEENVVILIEMTENMLEELNGNIDKLNFKMIKIHRKEKKYISTNTAI